MDLQVARLPGLPTAAQQSVKPREVRVLVTEVWQGGRSRVLKFGREGGSRVLRSGREGGAAGMDIYSKNGILSAELNSN